jgi:hypothetical protein
VFPVRYGHYLDELPNSEGCHVSLLYVCSRSVLQTVYAVFTYYSPRRASCKLHLLQLQAYCSQSSWAVQILRCTRMNDTVSYNLTQIARYAPQLRTIQAHQTKQVPCGPKNRSAVCRSNRPRYITAAGPSQCSAGAKKRTLRETGDRETEENEQTWVQTDE